MKKDIRTYKRNGVQFAYFLDCIYSDAETDEGKVKELFENFKGWQHPYVKIKFPNLQDRLEDWLRGLPVNIEYCNYNIAQIGKKWGYCKNEKAETRFVDNWWRMAAYRYLQLAEHFGVDVAALY